MTAHVHFFYSRGLERPNSSQVWIWMNQEPPQHPYFLRANKADQKSNGLFNWTYTGLGS
jgi:hypothetical protein